MRRLPRRAFDFYWGEGIADDVPALTYYLVLSLAPFALGLAALEALLLDNYVSALEVADQLNRFLPDAVHSDVRQLVLGTRADSPQLLAIALIAMLWTTSGGIGVIERCLSRILACERHHIVTGRLRNALLGAGIAAAVILASATTSTVNEITSALRLTGDVPAAVLVVGNTLGSILLFGAIYRYAPRTRLRWRAALLGGVPAGVTVQVLPAIIGLYVGAAAGLQALRLFFVLAVILIGLYAMATALLVGAGVAARAQLRHGQRERRRAGRFGRTALSAPERSPAEPG
jgi:membrane protein